MKIDMNESLANVALMLKNELELYDSIYGTGKNHIIAVKRNCEEVSLEGGWRDINILLENTCCIEDDVDSRHGVEYSYWLVSEGHVVKKLGVCIYNSEVERSLGNLDMCELVLY